MNIIKRSGEEMPFMGSKILAAVKKANKSVSKDKELKDWQIDVVVNRVSEEVAALNRAVKVDEIQNLVEQAIMALGAYEVAKSYVIYRYRRDLSRKGNSTDSQILSLVECNNEEVKQENSNKNPTVVSVQRDYIAGETSKDICRRLILPKDVVKAHDEGIIHFHDMDYFIGHMHNCFSGGTRFVTDRGIREFRNFGDGERVTVVARDGKLREATVRVYGNRKMQYVTLKNPMMRTTVLCTRDHRWYLADGSVTTSLKVGDRLACLKDASGKEPRTLDEYRAWCLGFSIGDGGDHPAGNGVNWLRVRLCGDKRRYARYFREAGWSVTAPRSLDGDLSAETPRLTKQGFLSGYAWRNLPSGLQGMVMRGLYAADGRRDGGKALWTSDDRVAAMVRDIAGMGGFHITSERLEIHDTNFKKDARLIRFQFMVSQPLNWAWKVESVRPKGGELPAYCVEEPVTHSFTLEKGVVTGNCDLVNLEDMLQNGTVISGTMIEKPHSFSTACNVATQIIAQVASCQYGGQSISLSHLAPFVEVSRQKIRRDLDANFKKLGIEVPKDKFDELVESQVKDEIKKGVQTIQYQVVTLMTTNGQAPFITVFMYLNEVKDEQTKKDLALVIEEVLKQQIQGVKNEVGVYVTPAFPKLIYVLQEDNIKEGTPYWYLTELSAKCTAKRMVPDYISEKKMLEYKINANGEGSCYTCMGCRSFLTPDNTLDAYGNIEKSKNYTPDKPKFYGRFNQGVVTINLVDAALSAEGDMDRFWSILEERCELCHKALKCRHERLEGTLSDAAPILWQHGALARLEKGEKIDRLLHGGYSTISLGYAGLWECVYALIGKKLTEKEGEELGLQVMQRLNDFTAKWKADENISYSLYGTPLESTTYKFAKSLQRRFGVIPHVTDKSYVTNSYHVHVTEKVNAFEKLALESKFQRLSPGGAISYVEVPNLQNNIKAVEAIMQFIYENIVYAELNTKSDYCMVCGFDGEIKIVEDNNGKLVWECPNCGNRDQTKMSVVRRSCGYRGSQFWNQGRTAEIRDRVLHVG